MKDEKFICKKCKSEIRSKSVSEMCRDLCICPVCFSKSLKEKIKLRIWHNPQISGKAFYVDVSSIEEAKKILDVLSVYDQFQFQENIKGDFSNASGVQMLDEDSNEWIDWENEEGMDFDEYIETNYEQDYDLAKLIDDNSIKF